VTCESTILEITNLDSSEVVGRPVKLIQLKFLGLIILFLGGCTTVLPPPSDQRPSDEPLYLAKTSFDQGDYGLSEKYFREAVEQNKQSVDAWLGLAASYDRLKRFDLASRSYSVAIELVGRTPAVLNNLGYHFLLQGKLKLARDHFIEAQRKAPESELIANNIEMLDEWKSAHGDLDHASTAARVRHIRH